jgi:Zn-finger nucleic acid-binding protein
MIPKGRRFVMKCPVCKTETLGAITLVENLPAHQCSNCGGIFIPSNAYLIWKRTQAEDLPEKEFAPEVDPAWDADTLKICPNCGHIMKRYKVLPDIKLFLDQCGHCNGVWLDKNEWNVLVQRNLHDNLNDFFTRPWQDKLHTQEARNHMERIYLEKLGQEDYERIQEIREWLMKHRNRGMLLAFLQADDPYKI